MLKEYPHHWWKYKELHFDEQKDELYISIIFRFLSISDPTIIASFSFLYKLLKLQVQYISITMLIYMPTKEQMLDKWSIPSI